MNIFAFDQSPYQSAVWLDDVRKNKMIVESCQLLSTTVNLLLPNHAYNTYKTCFVNHPCAKWVRQSRENFEWLLEYTRYLYNFRCKPHKSLDILLSCQKFYDESPNIFPEKIKTPFANCAANKSLGISFHHIPDTNAAYRLYIRERWKMDSIKLSWEDGSEPWWR